MLFEGPYKRIQLISVKIHRAPQLFRFENSLNFLSPSFYKVTTGLYIFVILYYTKIFIKVKNFLMYEGVDLQKNSSPRSITTLSNLNFSKIYVP